MNRLGQGALADAGSDSNDEPQVGWWEGIAGAQERQQAILSSPRAIELSCQLEEEIAAQATAQGLKAWASAGTGAVTRASWELMVARETQPAPGKRGAGEAQEN